MTKTTQQFSPEFIKKVKAAGRQRVSLVIFHRNGSEVVALEEGQTIVVGREVPSDVCIADDSLSRQHARFSCVGPDVWVEDLDSTNGTKLDGETIERERLTAGAEVAMGAVTASLHMLETAESHPLGLDGHDRFCRRVEEEVTRARYFDRTAAVLTIVARGGTTGHLGTWCPRVRGLVRTVDRMALYSGDTVQVLLPEASAEDATGVARAIVDGRREDEPLLLVGMAVFPVSATSADKLIAVGREAIRIADEASPIVTAPSQSGPRTYLGTSEGLDDGLMETPGLKSVFETVDRVARAVIPVLIQGETGSGKEIIARAIHDRGARAEKPIVCVNCAAIPAQLLESTLFGHEKGAFTGALQQQKGVFEAAHEGTVFLDEIGELPAAAQAALLRTLEEKKVTRVGSTKEIQVDARILAATHRDLEAMCDEGTFRWDLYYRLNVLNLQLPPLRARPEDVAMLADRFVRLANTANGTVIRSIDRDAMELLRTHPWPGNVRELRNAIDRAVVIARGDTIAIEDLPEKVRAVPSVATRTPPAPSDTSEATTADDLDFKEIMRKHEASVIEGALAACSGNQTEAARRLKMPLRTFVHKLKTLGIRRNSD